MDRLKGKVTIITGAGSGIGRAAARIFAAEGAKVAVAEIDPASGAETVALVEKAGGTARLFKTDVADPAAVEACVRQTVAAWGRLDVLYNNAGGMAQGDGAATEVALEVFWETINRNLFGTFLFCRFAIPAIVKSGGGSVINTSSILALQGAPGTDCYTASKGAVTALTASLAARFGKEGVRVNAIAPGMTRTVRIERLIANHEKVRKNIARYLLGTVMPEEVAYLAVFLASDESKHLSGAVIPIDSAGRSAPAAWM